MTKQLQIADDFALPVEAVTQTFAVLAKRGVGKTYTASVMAEEMLRAGHQVVAIDPTGAWWGLRSEFPVVILGGEHADVPLEESAGEAVARAIVEHRFPAVLDLSLFRKGQMFRFMTAFAEALYRLNREAVHLFVDEADAVAPQARNYGGDENRLLGAMEDIVRRGRKRGIGCTLITQRPAVLNKNVLTQCEVLVALRLVHPADIGAIKEWVNVHAEPAQAKEMIDSLPSLPVGTAWFWSPGWGDIFQRVKVRKRTTFDSSATPKPGEQARRPGKLAPIDLAKLGDRIRQTAEEAKANDPAALKRRVADLERQLTVKPAAAPAKVERVEVPVLKDGQLARAEKLVQSADKQVQALTTAMAQLREAVARVGHRPAPAPAVARPAPPAASRPAAPRVASVPSADGHANVGVGGPGQKILDALAWWESVGVAEPSVEQCGMVAGYSPHGGSFGTYLSRLSTGGMVVRQSGRVSLTAEGQAAARRPDSTPDLSALHERIRAVLDGPGTKIVDAVIAGGRDGVQSVADVAAATGYSAEGGSFGTYLSRLSTLGLIRRGKGEVRPAEVLFPAGLG
jgi:hypothetical protein